MTVFSALHLLYYQFFLFFFGDKREKGVLGKHRVKPWPKPELKTSEERIFFFSVAVIGFDTRLNDEPKVQPVTNILS